MVEPWNDKTLLAPPVNTYKCESGLNVSQLLQTCINLIKVMSKQSPLHREAAICSRFLYKFDKKFRNDIGYRSLKKVNTALRRYLSLSLLKDAEDFLALLPKQNEEFYLPTKQMLEYLLIRILAFSKLILRICICSKQAAIFYLDRLKRGESYWMSLMPYALLSRIWSVSTVLLQRSSTWYTNLYPYLDKLKLKGIHFLQSEYKLPDDIEEWLDMKNFDNIGKFEWSQKKQVKFDQLIAEDEEGDTLENILEFVDKINDVSEADELNCVTSDMQLVGRKYETVEPLEVTNISVDCGEKISRDIFKTFYSSGTPQIKHSAYKVTNKVSLQQFITTEETFRNEGSSHALTGHLSFMQWQSLKNSLLALLESLANNRKIERKFQKIWEEKCIDCK